jgi:hypothetical protein
MRNLFLAILLLLFIQNIYAQKTVYIKFENIANGKLITLDSTIFTNIFKEQYSISKLKYYISNISFAKNKAAKNVTLIDASKSDSIKITLPKQKITALYFQLGVDSLLNCSGAQAGALDPLNAMFWTWSSGYINFKLEGKNLADSSTLEHHIGGYKAPFKTAQQIKINITPKQMLQNKTIVVQLNLDNYWKSKNEILLTQTPIIANASKVAAKVSENFVNMFSIKNEN